MDPLEGIAFTEAQIQALIDNIGLNPSPREQRSGELAQMVLAIGMWAGLRPSEILALRFEDIDLDKGSIQIRRAHVYGKTKNSTKTNKDRVVYYLSPLAKRLRLWVNKHREVSINGWLLENRDGNPINLNQLSDRIIWPAAQKMGLHEWKGAARGSI